MTSKPSQPTNVGSNDQLGPLPKLLGDGGACFWCGQKLLGQCKSHYDSLTCVQRPLDEENEPMPALWDEMDAGPTPAEWAELDANARGQK